MKQRIAVIGAGIAGLSAAWLLRHRYDVTLFEAASRAGGHADTQDVSVAGQQIAVDTGFIVYNTLNYPNLTGLFAHLDVPTIPTTMSFGVSIGDGALEYGGGALRQLFAQRRNVVRPRFWSMIRDLLRFYREAPELLSDTTEQTLGDYLERRGYGRTFINDHILPMGAAIWSSSVDGMRDFPARHFARFFANHGLLQVTARPEWRTVQGGSRIYVWRMIQDLPGALRLGMAARAVHRGGDGVTVRFADGSEQRFDQVVLACHADQALALLDPARDTERAVLSAIRCQDNMAVLHTDARLMPRRRGVWSAWNYMADSGAAADRRVSVTYWMNALQSLRTAEPLLVSLNPSRAPDPARVLATRHYRHPQFDTAAIRAQARLPDIQGGGGVWFAGAWTAWGFHEDGITSAVTVARALGVPAPWAMADQRPDVAKRAA